MKTANFSTLIDNTNKQIFRIGFIVFVLAGLIITPIISYLFYSNPKILIAPELRNEKYALRYGSYLISDKLSTLSTDVKTVSSDEYLKDYLDNGSQSALDNFSSELVNISRNKTVYDKIRFIASSGQEVVRVNYKFGSPYIVPKSKLQDKSERYFFVNAMNARRGDIYISPMDLNEDNGMIEIPFKPMIRAAVQVYDSKNKNRGVFVINYMASDLLEKLKALAKTSNGEVMLVNGDGYWLLSNVEDDQWGFQLTERSSRKFQYDFPDEWQTISTNASGQIYTDKGVFTYCTQPFNGLTENQQPFEQAATMKLILYMPQNTVSNIIKDKMMPIIQISFIIFLLACIPAWLALRFYAKRKLNKQIIDISSNFDPLTKLPNRFAFFNTIEKETTNALKFHKTFALVLIDFSDFKQINKQYGMKAGDQLLKVIFEKVTDIMPEKTFVSRIKNDDFAMIFKAYENKADIEKTAQQIIDITKDTSALYGKEAKTTVNLGISIFPKDGNDIETLIANTKAALNHAKDTGTNNFVFYSELKPKA